jgi:2-amino-4-hydroxy-6-hydroxymethyldihydropteridine diphosphokinase
MNTVYLLIGGNRGNRIKFMEEAREMITGQIGSILRKSYIYETEPWGFDHQDRFLNQCLMVKTHQSPHDVLKSLQKIEKHFKRMRHPGLYESRNMDIDILFYNDMILIEENLKIPHPLLHKRKFALIPLVEVNPDFIHPVFSITVSELLKQCNDNKRVVLYRK